MTVGHEMGEIERVIEDALDPRAEHEAKQTGRSRLNGYEKTLRTVEDRAGGPAMRELAAWLRNQIRERRELPSSREVRRQGRRVCETQGVEVPPDTWLWPG